MLYIFAGFASSPKGNKYIEGTWTKACVKPHNAFKTFYFNPEGASKYYSKYGSI